ncbi:MAG TPA: cobalamin-independent methionine synthase II family protein [Candidatus Acidoferrales bacterium]|nr:cobalamin-independent methionine synthase II family protein [Candidatus Acidoferrales bacterium]
MHRSEERILTTHAGSLPRPAELTTLMIRKSRNEPVDALELRSIVEAATRRVVAQQIEAGIDIGNNGEQPRESFFTYVQHRLSGFGGSYSRPIMRDIIHYQSFLQLKLPSLARRPMVSLGTLPKAVGEVRYVDRSQTERECADFKRIAAQHRTAFVESFMSAASPGIVACAMENEYYPSIEDYLDAVANALCSEYELIASQGFTLQIDCPDLAMERHTRFYEQPLDVFLRFVDHNIAAINRALTNIAREQVRLHVCWGNYEAPHIFDVELDELLPHLYRAKVGALVLSMANPRHAHEYKCFRRHPLPDGILLVAGVIDPTTNYVEHPEVVAERIERVAEVVGDPHRVLAGTDCGFDTSAGLGEVAEEVVWEKLRALRAGADLASRRLFG